MKETVIIFPNQLFAEHSLLKKEREVFLVEEPRYFTDFDFHKKKLIFHRASMKAYQELLKKKKYTVHYIEFDKDWKKLTKEHKRFLINPFDKKLESQLPKDITIQESSPAFLGGSLKKAKRYLMGNFYKEQRKRLGILTVGDKPVGGKWSFDEQNRKPLPKGHVPPKILGQNNEHIKEATHYVNKHFPKNPGQTEDFIYPVTHKDAENWLDTFIKERLKLFGDYEDAIVQNETFLYHSILSPLINAGLLTPSEVLEKVLGADAPINCVEGFIRQVIGWREFILQIYLLEGENQRASNFFGNKKKIPESFYSATTDILPIDNVIEKVNKHAYCHHIERLMVLSNYMLLNEYDPNEIYRWFMELFIDAYDWVMVPNVYGMAQFADGGLMSTKPYISSSNYIRKMSNFKKGDWCDHWDSLYWDFLEKHYDKLKDNPRMALILKQLEKRRGHQNH